MTGAQGVRCCHNVCMASPEEMTQAVQQSMKQRTGRDMDEWAALIDATEGLDPLDQLAVRRFLSQQHGVPQNSQWAIAMDVAGRHGWVMPTADEFADQMYAKKPDLRPVHDAVVALAASMGADARVEGRATYTPVVRKRQFLAVGPGPRGTVRVGLRYRETPADERIEPAKGFAQATHWVHLTSADEVDGLEGLVREAYSQNG